MRISRKQLGWVVLVAISLVLTTVTASYSATTSGTLPGDETWSGTVTLTGDVTVPVGVTLTIEPGTEIVFPAGADDTGGGEAPGLTELIVNGSLSAVGAEGSKITFRSSAPSPAKGDWGGIRVSWGLGVKTLELAHCIVQHASAGVYFQVQNGVQSASITNTRVAETSGTGLYVYAYNGAQVDVTLTGNDLENNDSVGIYAYAYGSGSTVTGTISGNTITGCGNDGLRVFGDTNGVATMTVSGNTIEGSGSYGVYIRAYDSTSSHTVGQQANVVFTDNTVSNSASYGIRVYAHDYGATDVDIAGGSVTGSGSHGIYADTYYYAESQVDIDHVTVTGNNGDGISLYPYNRSRMRSTVSGNTLSGNSGRGIYIYARNNYTNKPKSVFVIEANAIDGTGSGAPGIYTYNEYSSLQVDVTGNTVHDATTGIYCDSYSYQNYTTEILVSANEAHDNTGTGIWCNRRYRSTMSAEVCNNLVYDNGGSGIVCQRANSDTMSAVVTLNAVYGNTQAGVICQATSPAVILKNDIHENGSNGLELTAGNGSVVNYNNVYNNHQSTGSYELVNGNGSSVNA
ncbi:MAG: right-handed parallel beta-helix repeat-containing protein, partial [Deltaproteobacteria bacterium]|nr:right-handed parallel beta-helix repeat-containing protein [Deltaproteobacteria bacterium]